MKRFYDFQGDKGNFMFSDEQLAELAKVVDNSTTVVSIKTPKGWKCPREKCGIDYFHSHTTFSTLATQQKKANSRKTTGAQSPHPKK